jgi:hypothetical protein
MDCELFTCARLEAEEAFASQGTAIGAFRFECSSNGTDSESKVAHAKLPEKGTGVPAEEAQPYSPLS